MSFQESYEWTVCQEEAGCSLLQLLSKKLSDNISSRQLKLQIEKNGVEVNGRIERFASRKVGTGDRITFVLTKDEDRKPLLPSIIYQDAALMVLDKPPGISSEDPQWTTWFPHARLMHRLDKQTSGVLLFARTAQAYEDLFQQFAERKVKKEYVAIVHGCPDMDKGVVKNFLGVIRQSQGQKFMGVVSASKGKLAETRWELLVRKAKYSYLRCSPITGRTHQIRVHLAGIGNPIVGDVQYGPQELMTPRPLRMFLHAEELVLAHPESGQQMRFRSPVPPEFQKWMEECA